MALVWLSAIWTGAWVMCAYWIGYWMGQKR